MEHIAKDPLSREHPDYFKRTVGVIQEALKDFKWLEGTEIRPCWGSPTGPASPDTQTRMGQQGLLVAAAMLVFPGKPEARVDPETGNVVMEVTACAAVMVQLQSFATGGLADDETIKARVRKKVEEYLGTFTQESGVNGPEDFRLNEWDYA